MDKKIVAKTNIKYGKSGGESVEISAGDEVNVSELGMTKNQLKQLYDAGAIELQESSEKREQDEEKQAEETGASVTDEPVAPGVSAPVKSDSQEKSSPAKTTPAKATTSEAKSSGKSNAA